MTPLFAHRRPLSPAQTNERTNTFSHSYCTTQMPRFKRAYRGLYGNRMIQFGNKISFAENKTRRTWKPNVQKKSMYSETLGRMLRFRMTTYVMRCIRKAGGLDEYLINTKNSELKFPFAIKMKEQIIELRRAQKEAATGVRNVLKNKSQDQRSTDPHAIAAVKLDSTPSALRGTVPAEARCLGLLEVLF